MKKLSLLLLLFLSVVARADTEIPFPGDPNQPPIVTSVPFLVEFGGTYSDGLNWDVGECLVVGETTREGQIVKQVNSQVCGAGAGPVPTQTPWDCGAGFVAQGVNTTPICTANPTPAPTFNPALANDVTWGNNSEAAMNWIFDPTGTVNPCVDFSTGQVVWGCANFGVVLPGGGIFSIEDQEADGVQFFANTFQSVGNGVIVADALSFPTWTPVLTPTPTPTISSTPTVTITTTPYPTPTNVAILHAVNAFTGQNTFSFTDFLFGLYDDYLQFGDQIEEKWINFDPTNDKLIASGGAKIVADELSFVTPTPYPTPTSIALLPASQTFTGDNTFEGNLTVADDGNFVTGGTGQTTINQVFLSTNDLYITDGSGNGAQFNKTAKLFSPYGTGNISASRLTFPLVKDFTWFDLNVALTPTTIESIITNRGTAFTITEVCCEVDTGTTTINLQRDDGSLADILAGNLTCNVNINSGCTTTFSGSENTISSTYNVDWEIVSNSAAKRVHLVVKYTIP